MTSCLEENPELVNVDPTISSKQQFSVGIWDYLVKNKREVEVIRLSKVPGSDEVLKERYDAPVKTQGKPEDYDFLIEKDTDVIDAETGDCVMRFRKGIFPDWLTELGKAKYHKVGTQLSVANARAGNKKAPSGVMGTIHGRNASELCRTTAFTRDHLKQYEEGLAFIQAIDEAYKFLMPSAYQKQWNENNIASKYAITNTDEEKSYQTAFSTVTVNATFPTFLHQDSGDYGGYGNLSVLGGNYSGCYTVFPGYRFAVNIRPGDFIAMNVHEWHCNTPVELHEGGLRLAFVCYLREDMKACQAKEKYLQGQIGLTNKDRTAMLIGIEFPEIENAMKQSLEEALEIGDELDRPFTISFGMKSDKYVHYLNNGHYLLEGNGFLIRAKMIRNKFEIVSILHLNGKEHESAVDATKEYLNYMNFYMRQQLPVLEFVDCGNFTSPDCPEYCDDVEMQCINRYSKPVRDAASKWLNKTVGRFQRENNERMAQSRHCKFHLKGHCPPGCKDDRNKLVCVNDSSKKM